MRGAGAQWCTMYCTLYTRTVHRLYTDFWASPVLSHTCDIFSSVRLPAAAPHVNMSCDQSKIQTVSLALFPFVVQNWSRAWQKLNLFTTRKNTEKQWTVWRMSCPHPPTDGCCRRWPTLHWAPSCIIIFGIFRLICYWPSATRVSLTWRLPFPAVTPP